ncbi:hypothetical protein AB8R75_06655 [Klebsiella quasipneumoniae subsp. similipneumoniae]|uniref:hypothetical protein n=1 Tax=Klebsiella quasipneumoniae TaxID=1463165 RepID=UPI0038CF41C5
MSGLIITLKGVVYDTGKKYYLDKTINPGTRSLFDMAEPSTGGGNNITAGAQIADLTYNGNTGTFVASKAFSNGGMRFTGIKDDGFDLPSAACMTVSDTHWMFAAWLKITNAGSSGFNNQTLHFSTVATNGSTTALLSLIPTISSGAVTIIELAVRGKNYVLSSQLAPLYDGARHQFAVECSISADGAFQTVKVYLDKVQVYSSTSAVAATPPGEPTNRRVGTTATLPLSWAGWLYRVRVDDITASGVAATEILSADYALCAGRFS